MEDILKKKCIKREKKIRRFSLGELNNNVAFEENKTEQNEKK